MKPRRPELLRRAKRRHRVSTLVLVVWTAMSSTSAIADATDAPNSAEPQLRFVHAGEELRGVGLRALRGACSATEVDVADPYHKRPMRYFAFPLPCVLDLGFEGKGGAEGQRSRSLLLRALDGYTRPASGQRLLEPGAYLAFGEPALMQGDESPPVFSKIDRRGVDPGPFYLVWIGADQSDPHVHPWPYQLATIEIAPFSEAFPHTVPTALDPGNMGWTGYELFQSACASCHAINGEGGKVGPDLNVPRSIVEYRPLPQIRSYIRNPQETRYTSMPAHPNLSESDLDALIAYFRAMSRRKHDPKSSEGS